MSDSNIYDELTNLQNELARLSTAVALIDKAKQTSVDVVNTGEQLNVRYDSQNKKIQEQINKLERLLKELNDAEVPQKFNKFEESLNNMWVDTHNRLKSIQLWIYILTVICSLTMLSVGVLLTS
jgi:hypothetical protein